MLRQSITDYRGLCTLCYTIFLKSNVRAYLIISRKVVVLVEVARLR
jgi:hypothetical protein